MVSTSVAAVEETCRCVFVGVLCSDGEIYLKCYLRKLI